MNIIDKLSEIKDFRSPKGLRHTLPVVLLLVIMGAMSKAIKNREIERFGKSNMAEICSQLGLSKERLPSHVTISKVMKGIGYKEHTYIFNEWANQYVSIEAKDAVAIDGKAMKSTVENYSENQQDFVSHVTAFCLKRGEVIGCMGMQNKKTSEIEVVRELIKVLDIEDVVFTMDALHSQKKQ